MCYQQVVINFVNNIFYFVQKMGYFFKFVNNSMLGSLCLKMIEQASYKHFQSNRPTQIWQKPIIYIIYFIMVRIIDNYTLYEVIGQGNYSKVYRAINKDDNKDYAVKVIEAKTFKIDKKLEQYMINQINILSNIQKSDHIIRFHGMLKSTNNLYFVYQYCNNGNLAQLIDKKKYIKQKQALKILKQLLQAFQVLISNHVMHRDLKPDNIFFNDSTLKLGDFGFCKNIEENKLTKTMLGSPIYMAPEILRGQQYTNKADIWSIGVVLYEMLYGYCPYQSTSINKLIQVIDTCEVCFQETINVSSQTKKLINRLLAKDVQKRISWQQLFQIRINQQGQYEDKIATRIRSPQPRSVSFAKGLQSIQGAKKLTKRPQTNAQHISPTFLRQKNFSVLNKKMKTQCDQKIVRNQIKSIPEKIIPIQQDTDDESLHAKFMRKRENKSGNIQHQNFHHLLLQKRHTTGDELRIVYYKTTPAIKELSTNKIIITNEHGDIIKGLMISKLFSSSVGRHSTLFTQLLLTQVHERLSNLQTKAQQSNIAPELVNLINDELQKIKGQLQVMKQKNEQYSNMIEQNKSNYINILKEKVPESKNWKLCYQMICYLLRLPTRRISLNEMKEEIDRILS